MLREEDEDIQNRVSDEENEEGSQWSTDIIRPNLQQQTPQNRRGRPAVKKKGEQDISKSWTDDEIEILMNLWVQCESLSNHKSQEYHNKGATFKKFSVYPK